jgi:hypothetical protein
MLFIFISRDTRRAPDAHTAKQITVDEAGRKSRNNVEMKGTTDPLFRENPKVKTNFSLGASAIKGSDAAPLLIFPR